MRNELRPLTAAGRRIVASANALFYQRGINPVGVALIAEHAGVTKKTLYDCFGSKEALVVRYLQERDARWWGLLDRSLESAGGEGVQVMFDACLDHPGIDTARGCGFLNAAAELAGDHPGLEVIRAHKKAVRDRLGELVGELVPHASAATSHDLAATLYLLLEGAMADQRFGDTAAAREARRLAAAHVRRASGDRQGAAPDRR